MRDCSNCKIFAACYWLMYCNQDPLTATLNCQDYVEDEDE